MEEIVVKKHRGNKGQYTAAMIIAVLSGTAAGVLGAITASASCMVNVALWKAGELEELMKSDHYWPWELGTFPGEHSQADLITTQMIIVAALILVFIASLIILCIQTGRFSENEDGSIRLNWFDRIWSEVQAAAGVCAAVLAVWLAVPIYKIAPFAGIIKGFKPVEPDSYYLGVSNNAVLYGSATGMAVCILAAVVAFVTLVKKIKARALISDSLIAALFRVLSRCGSHVSGRARSAFVPRDTDPKATLMIKIKYIAMLLALIVVPLLFLALSGSPEVMLIVMLVMGAAVIIYINNRVNKFAEIRDGVIEVKSGNLTHKISVNEDENGPKTNLDKLASDINHISEATNVAVQNEIKNQRLKTDLISNVSHDLKTPLTSMISYLDILEKEGLDSPDAPAHLAVVKEKTERLRTLTEELFEAAKASSGNIPCEITDIDLAALIDQSLAEMGDRLDSKELVVKKNIKAENTMVRADGKLLYRVLENLLSNISKYALEKSRVYIDVTDRNNMLLMEVKNISRDELNISTDELMERFTRGDQSRNTEGSGLGLAIAKDLTTLMGGVFEISIDGDMFKASVLLHKA
ncbi:MAG: GHKL domain-containing protein [Mogibacterium sp.]|nr:GHKL domain-containing protein [Mogibacterium sp.]